MDISETYIISIISRLFDVWKAYHEGMEKWPHQWKKEFLGLVSGFCCVCVMSKHFLISHHQNFLEFSKKSCRGLSLLCCWWWRCLHLLILAQYALCSFYGVSIKSPLLKKPHILIPEICGNPGSENILWLVFPMALVQTQFAEENQKALQFAQVHVFKAGAKYNMRPWHQNREFDKL